MLAPENRKIATKIYWLRFSFPAWKQGKQYEARLSQINTDFAVACSYSSTRVEMRGVEPLSENALTETSPGADDYLNSLGEA